jgi:RNA polymerase I-specific transcription initiation factor RRN6
MSGFPSLQPAFTVRVNIDAPMQVGGQAGPQLAIVPMTSGTVKSEEGFEPKLDGELHGVGYDYIRNDADGANMRLDVRSQVKNHDGTVLAMYYKGTVKLTPGVVAILTDSSDAKTTEYGDSFVNFSFETGNAKYAELQNGTYVAAGHFVKEAGKPGTIVEYKVSKVVYKA